MLLPSKSRRFAQGGAVSLDPNDPTLPADPVARQRELLRRQNLQAQEGGNAGQQVGQGAQQLSSLASTLGGGAAGAAGATSGLASVAGAAGPIGAAVAAGAAIGGALHKSNLEDDGMRNTSTGGQIKDTLGNVLDPIGTAVSAWGNDKLNVGQKILSSIPGLGATASTFFTKKIVDAERIKQQAKVQQQAIDQGAQQTRSLYGGLSESVRAGQYRGGGLLPKRFAGGGKAPAPVPAPAAAPVRYTVKNPSPQAQQYYQQVVSTMKRLIGEKHDETYLDPATGKQCTANSCLSFANTVQEQAMGQTTPQVRTKAQLYNPEFTRTSEQQGWVRIPLNQAQAGDRLQSWEGVDDLNKANLDVQDNADIQSAFREQVKTRMGDLGGRQYIQNKYPNHMMVLGAPLQQLGDNGPYRAQVYNDGHEHTAANIQYRNDVGDNGYVVYRYIGVNGQPTNNPAQAVAPNPAVAAAPAAAPASASLPVARRAKGGLLPAAATKSVIAHGALHSERNQHVGHATAGKRGIPVLAADGTKLAEVERDELTLSDTATQKLEKLRAKGDLLGMGKHLQQELLTNTVPSPRYKKRLLPTR